MDHKFIIVIKAKHLIVFFVTLILLKAFFLVSEELTITTYYPSPYGVYKQLKTRENTFLATTPAAKVVIGLTAPITSAAAKVHINGAIRAGGLTGLGFQSPLFIGNSPIASGPATGIISVDPAGALFLHAQSGRMQIGRANRRVNIRIYGTLTVIPP